MNFFFTLVDVFLITDSFGFTILKGKHYNITALKNHTIKKKNLTGHFEPMNFFFQKFASYDSWYNQPTEICNQEEKPIRDTRGKKINGNGILKIKVPGYRTVIIGRQTTGINGMRDISAKNQ